MKAIYIITIFLLSLGSAFASTPVGNRSLKGKITDGKDGTTLIGVNIYFPELKRGAVSDDQGNYHINNLPSIKTTLQVTYLGHQTIVQTVDLKTTEILNFSLKESNAQINEVVITALTGNTLIKKTPSPISYVSKRELEQQSSTNIIDAIAKQPGVSQITTGSSISKPVIRGLGYNRVVVVNDGVRQEGQQWGDEHGIEIDAQSVNSVEILKGPASLMYGSDAMAGVINFQSAPILPVGSIKANVATEYQSNNGLFNYSVNTAGNKNGFVWNWRYSDKMAHSYKNKYDGYVYDSGFRERALSGLLGINRNWGYTHLTLDYYHLTPGIVEGERDEETGKFLKPVIIDGEEGEAVATDDDNKSYTHQMPYQQIYHYKAILNNNIILGGGNLRTIIGYQQNRRQEFEDILSPKDYGLYFQLHTLTYDVRYSLPEISGYKIVAGANGMYQKSLNKGTEFLIPEYNLFDIGAYAVASRTFGKLDVSGGIRFDHRSDHSKSLYLNEDEEVADKNEAGAKEKFAGFSRNFSGVTGSLGLTYQLSDSWHTKLNLSRGFRAPNMSELASNGAHEGTIRYEIGNTALKAENSWQADWGLGYSSPFISGDLSLFANRINNYIFSHKLVDANGQDVMTDGYETYQFVSGNARIMGGELSIDIHPVERLHFQNTFSYVNSVQLNQPDSTKYLPFTPAPKLVSDIRYDIIRDGKTLNNTYISFGIECNMKQDHIYSAFGTETATPSYTLLNASIGTDFMHKGHTLASLYFTANNLTDKAYQSHLSRLKYGDVNQVTGREGVYNMGRNFGVKLLIPLSF
ncbi:TonB-dependent receptor [uncultured Bacteroides sp.]|uniref:TonB-dependent receptor n=1 Tax=uncultured Bacteroides sp. TaxID=162156 RepID=UPI002AA66DFC|nr:TonB-dependent receptor [uncultured Bacteroides sp.]